MKKLFTLLLTISFAPFIATAQNVGVDVAAPVQKLDVAGGIKIGNTANGVAGSLRWDGTNIQYHDGTSWVNLVANSDDQALTLALNILSIEDGNTVDLSAYLDDTDDQTLSLAANILSIVDGNTVDLSAYLDNTDAQTLSISGTDLTITDGNTVDLGALQGQLVDADNDTKVQVEESADEDVIRFDVGGNERWVMRGTRLENSGTGMSVFIGENAGMNQGLGNRQNTAVGVNTLSANVSGINNTAIGKDALNANEANSNTAVGLLALGTNVTGQQNTAVGVQALENNIAGVGNVAIGANTSVNSTGSYNTAIGKSAGSNNMGDWNVFIGNMAGQNEYGSNKLYIDNSGTNTPLIYGDFDDNILQVNGTLNVNGAYDLPTADGAAAGYVMTTDAAGNVSWTNPDLQGDITSIIAGDGLTTPDGSTGDVTIDINPDNSTIEVDSDILRVKPEGITTNEIATDGVDSDEIAEDAVGLSEIATGGVASAEIVNSSIEAIDINTGAVTTDEILDGTILPADVNVGGTANQILAVDPTGTSVIWTDAGAVSNQLTDLDADTKIEVEASSDEDYIRMTTAAGEAVTIDPAGNVGIGIVEPTRSLHVSGASGGQIMVSRADATVTSGETLGEILFDAEDDNASTIDASAVIRAVSAEPTTYGNSDKGGHLTFLTKSNATDENAVATEHMRITQDGKVAVGTTSPNAGAKMTIANGDDSFTYYGPNTTWGSGLYTGAGESTVSAGNAQVISTNGNLHLDAGTGQNVVIGMYTASNTFINHLGGSVGIGNMTPSAKLDVTGGAVQIGTNSYEIGAVDGGLSIGNTSANYNPTTANWASGGGTTMLISGQDYSSIGFHDSGSRVDYIRAGAGVMQLGYNAGWGAATIQLPSLAGGGNRLVRAANNGDLSAISTLVGTGLGDNLGNHTATTTLDMGNQSVTNVSHVQTQGSDAYDKIRLWNSSDYSIGMRSGMSLGYLNDYAMTFTMNNDADRGWVFRDAADGTNDGAMSLTTVGDMYLKGHLLHNGNIRRTAHNNGFLEGSYNNVGGNSSYTNPIYTIGSNYNPNPTSLSNMYGIGYSHGNFWGSSGDRPTGWGQYVAADGDARIILDASGGHVWASGTVRANGGYKVDGLTVIDDGGGWHRSYGNTGWYNGTHGGGWYMQDNTWVRVYNNKSVYSGTGEIRSDNLMRAPIFYDQNDGNYWLDPNAGLSLNAKGDLRIGQGSTTDDDWIYFDQNNSQWFGWKNSWGDFTISEDLNMGDRSLWDVNNLQVNTIYDNEDTRVEIIDDLRIDYAGSSTDVYFDGHNGHPAIRPGYAGWGYLGKFNNWWLEQWAWREYRNGEYYFSDRRVKQNIRSLDSKRSLEKVMALNGKIYDFNPETHPFVTEDARDYEITNNLGFIAQELKEVIPEMVVLDENTGLYQVMNSEQLFPVMIEAMKEQQKQIEALKGGGSNEEVESLRNEVQELRGLINKLMEEK